MIRVNTIIQLDPLDKIDDIIEVEIIEGLRNRSRVEIHIGINGIYMNFDQAVDFANKINEKLIPLMEKRQEIQNINLQVGDQIKLEDKLGGK